MNRPDPSLMLRTRTWYSLSLRLVAVGHETSPKLKAGSNGLVELERVAADAYFSVQR